MQYEYSTEKMAIIPRQVTLDRSLTNDIFKTNLEIKCMRRKILVLLLIELVVMGIYLTVQLFSLILQDIRAGKVDKEILIEAFITLISIVYLIVFIIVMTQCFPSAILIFIWLTLIQLLGGFILLPLAIMAIVISLSLINSVGAEIILDIIFIIVGISIIVLSVLIILHLLNLLKLIK